MQRYVTPHPGRTPVKQTGLGNVIDEEHYKVNVRLTELRNENWQVEIETWIPEQGWSKKELFLTLDELRRLHHALAVEKP